MERKRKNETKIRLTKIQIVILKSVALAGVLSIALLAPNALQLLKFLDKDKKKINNKNKTINISRKRMIQAGFLAYSKNGFLTLTKKGEQALNKIKLMEYRPTIPKKWDKKWRVLIFDIKENRKRARDQLRFTLNSFGFVKLQNSVWLFPYDCEDFINLLKADFCFGKEVLYMTVEKIEGEEHFLNIFNIG